MKKLLLVVFCMAGLTIMKSQELILTQNFDGFTSGLKFTEAFNDKTIWTTWDNNPGGTKDAVLSDRYAVSAPNSLVLSGQQDIVMLLGGRVSGRYVVEFDLFVHDYGNGYFNLLNEFAGNNSSTSFEVYFNWDGKGIVNEGKTEGIATFFYTRNKWFHVSTIIDLDDDFMTLYVDDEKVISRKWSSGSDNTGIRKLDAANFWTNSNENSPGMYIDNVVFSTAVPPSPPTGLKAEKIGGTEVLLRWDPATDVIDDYMLTANGEILDGSITQTYYLHKPYPAILNYGIRSHKTGVGLSHSSETVSVEIEGGKERKYVLFEIGTGIANMNCPGAAMAARDMIGNGNEVIIINYHNQHMLDPFNTAASKERAANYYGITNFPTSIADGIISSKGGSLNVSLFPAYHQNYNQRKDRRELFEMEVEITHLGDKNFRANIRATELYDYIEEDLTLHTAVTESDIVYNWQNQTELDHVLRSMYPDAFGTKLDFSDEKEHALTFDFTLGDTWVKDNLEFVVFLQADPSKEVMVATKVSLKDVLLNLDDMVGNEYAVYPNPVQSVLNVRVEGEKTFEILDITGKKMLEGITSGRIGVGQLESGMYFIRTGDGKTQKFIKQ